MERVNAVYENLIINSEDVVDIIKIDRDMRRTCQPRNIYIIQLDRVDLSSSLLSNWIKRLQNIFDISIINNKRWCIVLQVTWVTSNASYM